MNLDASAIDQGNWQATARAWAKEAWEHNSGDRNGLYFVPPEEGEAGYFVIYNNHPYAGFPRLREQELAEIRCRLNAAGIAELAYATYPHWREGYTYVLVLAAKAAREGFIKNLVNRAMDVCWSRRIQA